MSLKQIKCPKLYIFLQDTEGISKDSVSQEDVNNDIDELSFKMDDVVKKLNQLAQHLNVVMGKLEDFDARICGIEDVFSQSQPQQQNIQQQNPQNQQQFTP